MPFWLIPAMAWLLVTLITTVTGHYIPKTLHDGNYQIAVSQYDTEFDEPFNITCPEFNYLYGIESLYDKHYKDRKFKFLCKKGFVGRECEWRSEANMPQEYDEPLNYTCQNGGIITGIESTHSNRYEDRIWNFKCCAVRRKEGHLNCPVL